MPFIFILLLSLSGKILHFSYLSLSIFSNTIDFHGVLRTLFVGESTSFSHLVYLLMGALVSQSSYVLNTITNMEQFTSLYFLVEDFEETVPKIQLTQLLF